MPTILTAQINDPVFRCGGTVSLRAVDLSQATLTFRAYHQRSDGFGVPVTELIDGGVVVSAIFPHLLWEYIL